MKFATLAGLPRSGSTLLLNILAQNSRVNVSGTSGLPEVLLAMRNTYTKSININAQPQLEMDDRFRNCCKGAILGWASIYNGCSLYIDKSRAWPANFEFLQSVDIQPKIVVTIRDLRAVLSSMEKLYRKNTLRIDPSQWGDHPNTTVRQRVEYWAGVGLVGESCNQIQDMFNRGVDKQVHFVKYEDLVNNPEEQLSVIYSYLDEGNYQHNFNNIEQITKEDDRLHGIPNLHNIKPVLEPVENDWNKILGVELSNMVVNGAPWFYNRFYKN